MAPSTSPTCSGCSGRSAAVPDRTEADDSPAHDRGGRRIADGLRTPPCRPWLGCAPSEQENIATSRAGRRARREAASRCPRLRHRQMTGTRIAARRASRDPCGTGQSSPGSVPSPVGGTHGSPVNPTPGAHHSWRLATGLNRHDREDASSPASEGDGASVGGSASGMDKAFDPVPRRGSVPRERHDPALATRNLQKIANLLATIRVPSQ